MKRIIAVNASPRARWNTGTLVREVARGAESGGAEAQVFDLVKLEKHSGCMSCFACKLAPNEGRCVFRDGLSPVLEAIRESDGLVIGTPNYLGDANAEFKALYERLAFQSLTYRDEPGRYGFRRIPVLFIMTSNVPADLYGKVGYDAMVERYRSQLDAAVGDTRTLIVGETLQVKDYSRYDWTIFDAEARQERHDTVFPEEKEKAFQLGVEMVRQPW